MAFTSVDEYVSDVVKMGITGIKKDNILLNAVTKALIKAQNRDSFDYLNDKNRDSEHLYDTFIRTDKVNIGSALKKAIMVLITATPQDPAKIKLVMAGISKELDKLFKENLKQCLIKDPSFKVWVNIQNLPAMQKQAASNAAKASKILGISDVKTLVKAMVAAMQGDDGEAIKELSKIAKEEKLKDKSEALLAALKKSGLMS